MELKCEKCDHIMKVRKLWRNRTIAVCKNCGFRIKNVRAEPKTATPKIKKSITKPVAKKPKIKAKHKKIMQDEHPKQSTSKRIERNSILKNAKREKIKRLIKKRRKLNG